MSRDGAGEGENHSKKMLEGKMQAAKGLLPVAHGAWQSPQDRIGLGIRCPRAGFAVGISLLVYYR